MGRSSRPHRRSRPRPRAPRAPRALPRTPFVSRSPPRTPAAPRSARRRRRDPGLGLARRDRDVARPAELGDRAIRFLLRQRLAVPSLLVRQERDAVPLLRSWRSRSPALQSLRLGERGVDRGDVVTVDLDRMPAERTRAGGVRRQVPLEHRRTALAQPVHVDDRDQVARPRGARRSPSPPTPSPRRPRSPPSGTRRGRDAVHLHRERHPERIGRPWPSDPVATSIHGISGAGRGAPCTGDPNRRNDSSRSSPIAPTAFRTEKIRGDAWPFDRTNRSFARLFGRRRRSGDGRTRARRPGGPPRARTWMTRPRGRRAPDRVHAELRGKLVPPIDRAHRTSFGSAGRVFQRPICRRSFVAESTVPVRGGVRTGSSASALLPFPPWPTTRRSASSACFLKVPNTEKLPQGSRRTAQAPARRRLARAERRREIDHIWVRTSAPARRLRLRMPRPEKDQGRFERRPRMGGRDGGRGGPRGRR